MPPEKRDFGCPACGSSDYLVIGVRGHDGYIYLTCGGCGDFRLSTCTKCGTVYVDKSYLEGKKDE